MHHHPILTIAVRAARKAGNFIAKHYETPNSNKKDQEDLNILLPSSVEKAAELIITETIRKSYPQHSILSKGSAKDIGINKEVQWNIEPLDGISNFVKRLPHFSVSISVHIKGHTEVAVVYDPMRNELFTANRGHGTQLNGYRLRGSSTRDLKNSIFGIGFPSTTKQHVIPYMNILGKFFIKCADFRRTGSTSLDLAYVAAGRLDGYIEISLKPWNVSAGGLIVREAGLFLCDFTGEGNYMMTGNLLAGSPRMVKTMLENIRDELSTHPTED